MGNEKDVQLVIGAIFCLQAPSSQLELSQIRTNPCHRRHDIGDSGSIDAVPLTRER